MARDYSWSRRWLPPGTWNIGDLAIMLGLGRHRTRRILLASGLPCRLIRRRWSYRGRGYSRRFYSIPDLTAAVLYARRVKWEWRRSCPWYCPYPDELQVVLDAVEVRAARLKTVGQSGSTPIIADSTFCILISLIGSGGCIGVPRA